MNSFLFSVILVAGSEQYQTPTNFDITDPTIKYEFLKKLKEQEENQEKELKICCKKLYWKGLLICACWSDSFYDCTKCGGKPLLNW